MNALGWFLAGVLTTVVSWWGLSIVEMTGTPKRKKNKYTCETCGGRLHPGLGCGPDTTGMKGGPTSW